MQTDDSLHISQAIKVGRDGSVEFIGDPIITLNCRLSNAFSDVFRIEVEQGQGLSPKSMWLRHSDMPAELLATFENSLRVTYGRVSLTLSAKLRPKFLILGIFYEGKTIPVYGQRPSEG